MASRLTIDEWEALAASDPAFLEGYTVIGSETYTNFDVNVLASYAYLPDRSTIDVAAFLILGNNTAWCACIAIDDNGDFESALAVMRQIGTSIEPDAVQLQKVLTPFNGVKKAPFVDGVYSGAGKGIGGKFDVKVTIKGGVITAVEVGDNSETQGIGSKAIEQLPALIVEANGTTGVDGVSGASVTSKAIFSAVEDCLVQAGA